MTARRPLGAAARSVAMTTLATRLYGVAFLVVLALLLGLSVAMFQQRFTPVVLVDLKTDHVGNQLQVTSDVKLRGLIVGQVRKISSTGAGATVQLALQPGQVGAIPADVSARLLPKTLFGERYVDLVLPAKAGGRPLREGDTIGQDRTSVAIELEQVFTNLLPLLRTVKPAELATTLNALATALDGRGERLGQNLVLVNSYLGDFNPNLPTLKQDISGLADVASIYADAAPDLLTMARNLSTTSRTLVQKQSALAGFLAGTAGFARTATSVLNEDGDRLIRVGRVSRPTLDVLEKYSPVFACFTRGLDKWRPDIDAAFGLNSLHITLEVVPQRPAYQPGEEPSWNEDRRASCSGLPTAAGSQADPYWAQTFDDGTNPDAAIGKSLLPPVNSALPSTGSERAESSAYVLPESGNAGTAAEQSVTDALFSDLLGTSAEQMPDISNLLLGPVVRGTEVEQR